VKGSWTGAEPAELPPFGATGWMRLVLRAILMILLTFALFAVFLLARGADAILRMVLPRPVPALAPRVVHLWGVLAMPLAGLRLKMRGTPMRHAGAIVANHASWLDIMVLQSATHVYFVAKAEVSRWPVIGFIGRSIGTMFIERRTTQARIQTAALNERLKRGDLLCIFPEGTSSDGQRVLPFKSSLFAVFFEPDLIDTLWVQPVSIVYRPRPGLPDTFYGWWGEMDFGAHIMPVLALSTGGMVEVIFHPALSPADFPNRKALAARSQQAVTDGFDPAQKLTQGVARIP
jgi:1-acyl-sn-glycerol-3-phosphate acyltransferase